jgi:group I intron endonuclease
VLFRSYFKSHINSHGPKIYQSILKYGWENHVHEIIEECTLEQLNERETYWKQYYISLLGWDKVLFCELYDRTKGGFRSDETKLKISQSNLGISRNKDKKHTDETICNMSKPKSIQHINNISKGKLGKPNLLSRKTIIQYDLNNNFIKEYDSYTSAKNDTKINGINNVVRGISKTAGGYLWKYKQTI